MKVELAYHRAVRQSYKGHYTNDIKQAVTYEDTGPTADTMELKAIILSEQLAQKVLEISNMDSIIVKVLQNEDKILEETDRAFTFQDKIDFWILKIKEFVAIRHQMSIPH